MVGDGIMKDAGHRFAYLFDLLIDPEVADRRTRGEYVVTSWDSKWKPSKYEEVRDIVVRGLQAKGRSTTAWSAEGERLVDPLKEKEDEAITDRLVFNSMFATMREFLAKFDLPSWDIRPNNVGYVVRDGKKQFVILDPGFELQ